MLTILVLSLTPQVQAAEVTDMPPALRGNAGLYYSGSAEWGKLEENSETFGKRKVMRHTINYVVEFAPVEGVAIVIDLPHTPYLNYSYSDATQMIYEPVSQGGTYSFGQPLDSAPSFYGKGIDGVWLGAAFAPFSETYKRKDQVTWRVDIGFRTPSSTNLWTAGPNGDKRGAAPGGSAFKISTAASRDNGLANPWMKAQYIRENKVQGVDVYDEDKTQWASGLTVQPPSSIDVSSGIELVTFYDPADETRIAFDVFTGFGYRTPGDIPSGLFLPSVLSTSRPLPVSVGDYFTVMGGMAFDYHVMEYVALRAGANFRYYSPHLLENVYPIRTSIDTVGVDWTFSAQGRFR